MQLICDSELLLAEIQGCGIDIFAVVIHYKE
jgi:hypothetical protein